MKKSIIIIFLFLNIVCLGQNIISPKGYKIIDKVQGDLDKDSIPELVMVYNTGDSTEFGRIREIQIFKNNNNKWVLWKKSKDALLQSEEGGMMGDPYGEVIIKNGILLISHMGGSSWKWSNTDKYRFQNNEFELIGYTSTYGKPCEYWTNFDLNLSTGKIVYKKEFEYCEDEEDQEVIKTESETFFKKGIKLNLNNRHFKEIKIISPKYKSELYL